MNVRQKNEARKKMPVYRVELFNEKVDIATELERFLNQNATHYALYRMTQTEVIRQIKDDYAEDLIAYQKELKLVVVLRRKKVRDDAELGGVS